MANPITLDALRILDAIDRKKSFAAAADELFRVPSAISYTVKKLEEDLGVVIFDRSNRKAEFTQTGALLLTQGRLILQAADDLTHHVVQIDKGWELEFRICIDNILHFAPIYQLIEQFQQQHPHVEIKLIEETMAGNWDAIESDRCDLVIGVPEDPISNKYQSMSIGEIEFVFAVAKGHPLTQLVPPISSEQIKRYPSIVVADSSRVLPPRSIRILEGQHRITVPSIEKKIATQCKGLGVGYLPIHRIKDELQSGELVAIEVTSNQNRVNSVNIAWVKSNQGKALQWFVQQLTAMDRTRLITGELI
ncbi:LysR family transcriptional regulator [Vibrio sp. 99-8-1]|uniref:LysR family transcriptional regulator n=1 Tax=Vibrio sp. 99-8-1 TaxID=2607602 RepID=UPI001493A126|nr:LysR family transcriptional regulator [Vibrio sp. 99-8-1]NOI68571.1 LysR family transcriptional regulator [Vibrio sp. 99-8-1]